MWVWVCVGHGSQNCDGDCLMSASRVHHERLLGWRKYVSADNCTLADYQTGANFCPSAIFFNHCWIWTRVSVVEEAQHTMNLCYKLNDFICLRWHEFGMSRAMCMLACLVSCMVKRILSAGHKRCSCCVYVGCDVAICLPDVWQSR